MYLLKLWRELVEGILLHHHLYLAQAVLIASHFGSGLFGMDGTVTDFILTLIAKGVADGLYDRTHHDVEKMMPLYI